MTGLGSAEPAPEPSAGAGERINNARGWCASCYHALVEHDGDGCKVCGAERCKVSREAGRRAAEAERLLADIEVAHRLAGEREGYGELWDCVGAIIALLKRTVR